MIGHRPCGMLAVELSASSIGALAQEKSSTPQRTVAGFPVTLLAKNESTSPEEATKPKEVESGRRRTIRETRPPG